MLFSSAFFAISALASHQLKVVLTADNYWELNLPGQSLIKGPKDGDDGVPYAWNNPKTYTTELQGEGPWVVGIKAHDKGVIAGLFAGVYLDGQPYAMTGEIHNKFRASDTVSGDWLALNYDDSKWKTGSSLQAADCKSVEQQWIDGSKNTFFQKLDALAPDMDIRATWIPNCKAVNKDVFFRLVIEPPVIDVKGNSNAVSKKKNCKVKNEKAKREL